MLNLVTNPTVSQNAKTGRDFIDIDQVPAADVRAMLALGHKLKKQPLAYRPFEGKTLALIFEKPSTRTRVSFEVAMRQLGGHITTLSGAEIQLGHGESIADTGRVLSRYVEAIMIRTFAQSKLLEMAAGATIPVINGLTNYSHPCQVMADIMTAEERLGSLEGKTVVWIGDGTDNVLISWMHAVPLFNLTLRIICPAAFAPPMDVLVAAQKSGAKITVTNDLAAAEGADIVITDCWVSMHNSDAAARHELLSQYQVNSGVMKKAKPSAIFMHCLPAHRGEEVTDDVLDGAQSAAWDEAENRVHAQKAILCWCLGADTQV